MNTDLLIACIIAGSFFALIVGIIVQAIIANWWKEERSRRAGVSAWVFCEEGGEMRKI